MFVAINKNRKNGWRWGGKRWIEGSAGGAGGGTKLRSRREGAAGDGAGGWRRWVGGWRRWEGSAGGAGGWGRRVAPVGALGGGAGSFIA